MRKNIKKFYQKTKKQISRIIEVENAIGEEKTMAKFLVQNKISYTPKVSVVMPVYNVEEYLRACLDSVTNQTLKEIEIICVDDGSTDNSLKILREYARKDKRISILKQKNAGSGRARNNAINNAKGEFIAFMDSDDLYPNLDTLEHMYKTAKKHKALICGGSLNQIKDDKLVKDPSQFDKGYTFTKNGFIDYKDYQFDFGYWRFIYNRQFLKNNQLCFPDYLRMQDPPFFIKAMALAGKFYSLKKPTYVYRVAHKEIEWTLRKAKDVVKGIIDGLTLSKEYHLDRLHYQYGKKKLGSNWLTKNVYDFLETNDPLLIKMLSSVDMGLMKKIDPTYTLPVYKSVKTTPISVIIPVYNVEKYLRECLDSVINQTLKDIEIICVNDGSPDNSLKILQEYAAKDKRIVIINQKNQGLSCSRNNALKIAKGEYILFLDSDDWIREDTCERLYTKAKKHNIDMVNFAGTNYDDNSKLFEQTKGQGIFYTSGNKDFFSREELEEFMYNIPISACRFFYRRAFLEENQITFPEGINFEDNYFVRKALIFAQTYGVEREILYFRRVHGESITQNVDKFFGDYIEVISRVSDLYEQNHIKKDVVQKIMQNYCNYLYEKYNTFRKEDRIKYKDNLFDFLKKISKEYGFYDERFKKNYNSYKNQLEQWWYKNKKTPLDFENPQTFNEKIQWLKLYDSTPIKTRLADKYLVRDWVKEKIGEEYLIPLLGVYNKFEDINFDKLPNQFVIKCNHGCGYNIIVKDKSQLDLEEVKAKLDQWMNENFAFKVSCELQYRDIEPKIIIEKFIENKNSDELNDYKFYCFGGKVEYIQVISDRVGNTHKVSFYDTDWQKQTWWDNVFYKGEVEKPAKLSEMMELAQKLCKGFNFVRVDLYYLDTDEIYFGEMTFSPSSGFMRWSSEEINLTLGKKIKLPRRAYNMDTGKYYRAPKRSVIKTWLLFPYYLPRWQMQKNKVFNLKIKEIEQNFEETRIDVKNFGGAENNAIVGGENMRITQPKWLVNAQGSGQIAASSQTKQNLNIKIIKDGKLRFDFRAQDKRNENGVHMPVWIDYKSIKIDGKEILTAPVATWHDKPFRYEMDVKDGQTVMVEIEQTPHQYEQEELNTLIKTFYPNLTDFDKISKKVYAHFVPQEKESFSLFRKEISQNDKTIYICGMPVYRGKINNVPLIKKMVSKKSESRLLKWIIQKVRPIGPSPKEIARNIRLMRIDLKNLGNADNNAIVSGKGAKISQPAWFANAQGKGTIVETSNLKQKLNINVVKDGKLQFVFRGRDRRNGKGVRVPVWIDYQSIKINGNEILAAPVKIWYEQPYRFEMDVKDGQEISLEIEQSPHQYEQSELKGLIKLFYPNLKNFEKVSQKVCRKFEPHRSLKCRLFHKKAAISPIQISEEQSLEKQLKELSAKIEKALVQMSEKVQSDVKALRTELIQKIDEQKTITNALKTSQAEGLKLIEAKTAELIQKQKDFMENQSAKMKEDLLSALNLKSAEECEALNATQNAVHEALGGMANAFQIQEKLPQELESLKNQQDESLKAFFEQMKQYYVSRTKTDNYHLEFRTFADLAYCIRQNLGKLPEDVDLVVGIPRSGMIPAYIIALFMNKKCCSLDEFLSGTAGSNGARTIKDTKIKKVLVVDDSVFAGREMKRTKEKLEPYAKIYDFVYATVYVKPESKDKVDIWFEEVPAPRVWQWNYLNHSVAEKACFDMDGVLCQDPTDEENDDGEKYEEFIKNVKPLYVPTYKINTIVTSRLEKYRSQTKKWLKKHGVQYKNLVMLDLPTAEERRQKNIHAKFKAEVYKNLPETVLFVESNPSQAREIALLSGKTVICTKNDEVY